MLDALEADIEYPQPENVEGVAKLTERLAATLGKASAIFMRGNGLVTAGESIEEAVVLTWYAEDAARVELEFLAANMDDVGILSEEDIKSRATWAGRIRERMWDYLTDGDPEGAR